LEISFPSSPIVADGRRGQTRLGWPNKQKRKDTKQMKKIWFGEIPDIFGYGISCLGNSKKEVMDAMKRK
jgi:hypothetical protein